MKDLIKSTVLIVSDTPAQSEMMCLLLQKAGYEAFTASNGREGFEVALRERPDLLISNLSMHALDEIELCRLLRAHHELCSTPILLAGVEHKDGHGALAALRAGTDDYLEMPCESMSLVVKATRLIERRRLEDLRRASDARHRLLFEGNPLPMWVYDLATLRILAVNQAALHHYGYTQDEFLSMTIKDIRPAEDVPLLINYIATMKPGLGIRTDTWKHRKKDGAIIEVEIASTSITWAGRSSMLVMVKDISDRKLLEKALQEREEQLRQASKMESIGRLSGGIAHDFNNLLTAINGYSDLSLRHLSPDEPLYRNIQEIKRAGERAGGLTRQLLAFGRKLGLQPKVLDLNAIVSDMKRMLPRLIGENIDLQTKIETALWPVKADQGQIEQLIMNLSVNAKDAMPLGGQLLIGTANVFMDEEIVSKYDSVRPGPHVLLTVSDTGSGIDPETQRQIFEPFFTTKKEGKGTGLGLSIVYGIVKQSGGYITVESIEGEGTTFKIYLPRATEKVEHTVTRQAVSELPRGTETILVLEDEELVREMTRAILETSGYKVLQARHFDEALTLCKQYSCPIDLLVTDVVMPQMSGPQIAHRLVQMRPDLRVLYMSGYTRKAIDHQYGLEEGQPFIEKPFTPGDLGRKVREVLAATN